MTFLTTQRDPEGIKLSEISQTQKDTHHTTHSYMALRAVKCRDSRMVVARGWVRREQGLLMGRAAVLEREELLDGDGWW